MRKRLVRSTLLIALMSVLMLGVPLGLLARNEVLSSARDQLAEQARVVAAGLEDRLDAGQPISAVRLRQLLPDRRVVVTRPHGSQTASGPPLRESVLEAHTSQSGADITVQEPSSARNADAWKALGLVTGLGLLAIAAAVGFAIGQARRLAGPLSALALRADRLGKGEFSRPELQTGISEVDEISSVLERSAKQIGALVAMQRDFASDAAHQLRTPLTGVTLRLEEIAYLGDEQVRQEAMAALDQTSRLDLVITALLARARGDSAPPAPVELTAFVRAECAAWARVLTGRHRAIVIDAGVPVVAESRREHVATILTTLLDNALEHGEGTITVSVRDDRDRVVVSVRDEGSGVPVELRPVIFERTVSGSRGTGIGLALARSLAETERGALTILDDGRTFELALEAERA